MNITDETKPLYDEINRLSTALEREEKGRLDAISDSAAWQRKYTEACDRITELVAERVATPNAQDQVRHESAAPQQDRPMDQENTSATERVPSPASRGYAPGRPLTMAEREGVAENAMQRDIDRSRDEYHVLMVPKNTVPPGAKLAECYETEREWVVVGEPWRGEDVTDPRYHNCDTMGCGTLFHVVTRIQKPKAHISEAQRLKPYEDI